MTATNQTNKLTTTRTKKALYWASTGSAALALATTGVADLARVPAVIAGRGHLGFPTYFATMIGVWNLLAVAAILAPGLPRLKKWAYAGLFFVLAGAATSHAISGDLAGVAGFPLVILKSVLTSWVLQPARSAAIAANSPKATPMPSEARA